MGRRRSNLAGAWLRLILAVVVGAAGATIIAATPALACVVDPDTGECIVIPTQTYKVTGADSSGLGDMTKPFGKGTNGSAFIKWFPNGTSLQVRCQANNGGQVDGRYMNGKPFTTWDKLADNTWVYDWYMNTPLVGADGYSPGLTHCPWSSTSSAAGNYKVTGAPSQGTGIYSEPHLNNTLRQVLNGTVLTVKCQVNNGDQLDGKTQYGHAFKTWDQLGDGTWIYDWYLDTPLVATDGYSPNMPHCAGDPSQRFVALGDSYSSGQGTYDYYGANPTLCRRSVKAYSYVYARNFTMPTWIGNHDPVLLACGGAKIAALTQSYNGDAPQLTTGALGPLTKLVTISIGGNDIGFADVIHGCLFTPRTASCWEGDLNAPGIPGYDSSRTGAYQKADGIRQQLVNSYNLIKQKAPYARVVVLGYPMIFPPTVRDCGDSLGVVGQMSPDDLNAIRTTWTHANAVIQGAASSAGAYYFDDSANWVDHDICSSSPYANGVRGLDPVARTADDESYHPNADGYWQWAADLATFINTHLS